MASPSQTVENYLKAIFQAQVALGDPDALVPMGRLSSALGVVPGTATTMVKALADSGLVEYAPYEGVRLTPAGNKLAALVLRRHRLIELFLVQVMGMSWAEVHEEAEQLEHAVSDRLIEKMDEMLGRPVRDPHGDPIPDAAGQLAAHPDETLLTCPMHVPIRVTRVADQDAGFLRFIEESRLKPGAILEVEERNPAADQVHVRTDHRTVTLGTRAASKLRVSVLTLLALMFAGPVQSQPAAPAARADPSRPFEIQDNSFLVEEAFNQEQRIYQNIFGFIRSRGEWQLAFTQEWPLGGQTHQASYTIPFGGYGVANGLGDAMLNYRYQVSTETASRPAFAPRISLILPTGGPKRGYDTLGYQVNLPLSKQFRDWYVHVNGGFTTYAGVPTASGNDVNLFTTQASASGIWRMRPMVHLMLEMLVESLEEPEGRHSHLIASPGVRIGKNIGDAQMVVGAAVPITFSRDPTEGALLLYFSYEL